MSAVQQPPSPIGDYRIYKYPLILTDCQIVMMPVGARVLSAKEQRGELCVWAMVDASQQQQQLSMRITIVGTGNPLPESDMGSFVDTVVTNRHVWHVYAR